MMRLAVLAFAIVSLAGAESYTHVSGLILDASGASAPGASVAVVNEDTGFRRTTASETDGRYVVSSLQPGMRGPFWAAFATFTVFFVALLRMRIGLEHARAQVDELHLAAEDLLDEAKP